MRRCDPRLGTKRSSASISANRVSGRAAQTPEQTGLALRGGDRDPADLTDLAGAPRTTADGEPRDPDGADGDLERRARVGRRRLPQSR